MSRKLSKLMQFILQAELGNHRHWAWRPAADIYRADNDWIVKLDLAGVRTEDVHVNVKGNHVVVNGVRRDWCTRDGHQAYAMEIVYDRFERAIELPCDVEQATIRKHFSDGMLLIHLAMEKP